MLYRESRSKSKDSDCPKCKKCDRSESKPQNRSSQSDSQIPVSNINYDIYNDQYSRFYWANNN